MKKICIALSLFTLVLAALALTSSKVFANDRFNHGRWDFSRRSDGNFNPDKQLSQSSCGKNLGNPLVDVKQKVTNDVDDGVGGNNWAFDYYTKNIKVWQTSPAASGSATYCAIVTYDGSFFAVPGQVGPGNIPAGEKIHSPITGDLSGGYRATYNGTFVPTTWPTHGNITPTTDYACVITLAKGDLANCPGYIDWLGKYFTSSDDFASWLQPWWGWQYKGGSHGTWINSSDGNTGNIL